MPDASNVEDLGDRAGVLFAQPEDGKGMRRWPRPRQSHREGIGRPCLPTASWNLMTASQGAAGREVQRHRIGVRRARVDRLRQLPRRHRAGGHGDFLVTRAVRWGGRDRDARHVVWDDACHGVEVSKQMECEAGEAGRLAGIDGVDPGGEPGAEAAGEHLAEVADMPGGRVQFGAAGRSTPCRAWRAACELGQRPITRDPRCDASMRSRSSRRVRPRSGRTTWKPARFNPRPPRCR